MTDMREKLANVLANAIITQNGENAITLSPDKLTLAWIDQGETDMGAVAQAAIAYLWPLAMGEAAKVAEERRKIFVHGPDVRQYVTFSPTEVAAAIRNRKAPL